MDYPRVLLLHKAKVHSDDPENLLVRNLFGGWPKRNIGQIYSGCYSGTGEFCDQYYAIGDEERRFGGFFNLLKVAGVSAVSGKAVSKERGKRQSSIFRVFAKNFVSAIIASGLWEVVFPIRLSAGLVKFVHEFKPDVVYLQGSSLGFTRLALELADQFNVPICYFPVDDWHSSLYRKSPVHHEVDKLANAIADLSSLRFALGPKMTERLTERYQTNFECIYNADDLSRFQNVERQACLGGRIVFGLAGSLYLGRDACLLDLLNACESIDIGFLIRVYCTSVPVDTSEKVLASENVEFLPLPTHDNLPKALAACDVLFLPESFDLAFKKAIELSLSTKSHLYMMSGRPILVYGPEWSGTVDYAKRLGWGVVIDRKDKQLLIDGIAKATSAVSSKEIVRKGLAVAKLNHDIQVLQKHVLERLRCTIQEFSA